MKQIYIYEGCDRGKYASITKVLGDGSLSVRFENGKKVIVRHKNYFVLKS